MRIQFSIEPLQVVKNKLRQCLIDTAIYLFGQASRERYISQTGVTGGMSHLVMVILQAVIARHSQCETAKQLFEQSFERENEKESVISVRVMRVSNES